ncbi:N-acetylmuramoyl-L-alanine amidase [Rhodovulum bhavnagarense]|uniref:N-acetylmuramoyl-L-alanine amidase n=1 Tax=Rhodovulum bhavnagarense TaxID=992286 RepID=A0A4R2RHR7_9RHOB|nr:N-acetylmuramoyl-L-alanine amidase [Rhodovulum bhavnagarense]TCP63280.1 N-acetylmuramoyl-L-alanine amidase [Rhodovulum bhavnagarense]
MHVPFTVGRALGALALWVLVAIPSGAQDLSALARPDMARSAIVGLSGGGVKLTLDLSQPVPYRLFTLADPPRLVADFREVDWRGADAVDLIRTDRVDTARAGVVRPGWSRLVLALRGPLAVHSAEMRSDPVTGRARLTLDLLPVDPESFAAQARVPQTALWGLPEPETLPPPRRRPDGTRPVRVVLDPGHGGIDPGAEHADVREADLMLSFGRELRDALRRAGFEVVMTRDADIFVPLETRIDIARRAHADVFLSLHADALADGHASGATIYTLSETASDKASALLAERHDRDALLAGVDLSGQDDVIAKVLMDLARTETTPRTDRLADALVAGLKQHAGHLYKKPRLSASFSVLKAPDIPSVLIELGFLSSAGDRDRLSSPEWRQKAARGIVAALVDWAAEDAAQAGLLRR